MYANATNETTFEEKNTIKISKVSEIEEIEISNPNEVFVDQDNNEYQATQSITYKSTMINKKDLEKIFGQEYEIKILNRENTQIATISNSTESDEAGNITINYDTELDYIKMITTHPETEGNITIQNTRAIKGNTGYTKEQLKTFNKLVLKSNVLNKGNYSENQTEIDLEDTVIEAKMEIDKTNLVAKKENEDVQILMTLLSNSNKYDLCKNPVIDITLPQELDMEVKNTELLNYEEEVKITKVEKIDREDGRETIRLNLEGEQASFASGYAEGIKIALMGNVNVANVDETKEEKVELQYINENSSNEQFVYEEPITINAIPAEIAETNSEELAIENENNEQISAQNENNEQTSVEGKEDFNYKKGDISVDVIARTGDKSLKDGDTVLEGQGIKYIFSVKNNTDKDIKNIELEATNTNAIYYGLVEYEDDVYGKIVKKTKNVEDESLTSKVLKIDELKAGESKEVYYQITVKKVEEENAELTGRVKLTIDDIAIGYADNIKNKIEKGKLKLNIRNNSDLSEDTNVMSNQYFGLNLQIENISNEDLTDIIVEIPLNEKFSFDPEDIFTNGNAKDKFIEYKDGIAKYKIVKLGIKETVSIDLAVKVNIPISETETQILQYFRAKQGGDIFISNETDRKVLQNETQIIAIQSTNVKDNIVKDGDNVKFIIDLENKGSIGAMIIINDSFASGISINNITLIQNGEENVIQDMDKKTFDERITLGAHEKTRIIIDTTIDTNWVIGDKIINKITFSCNNAKIEANEMELTVKRKEQTLPDDPNQPVNPDDPNQPVNPDDPNQPVNPDDPNQPANPDDPNNPVNPDDPNNSQDEKTNNYIDGVVWIDENKNGNREESEAKLANIPVMLLDEENKEIVKDNNGKEIVVITNKNGSYKFENLKEGKYSVIFAYDNKKYKVTEYQKNGVPENTNSDIIKDKITIDGTEIQCAKTKEIEVKDKPVVNVDAGFIELEKFDLKLSKYINRITIEDSKGTKTIPYNKTQLAKAEIAGSRVKGAKITIEYEIEVSNEGEMPGYVREIVDYLPSDLKFSKQKNPTWSQNEQGNLYTTELQNQQILPGETKSVKLILIKTMTQENTGTITNRAEISKCYNENMIEDIDSTPGNQKEGEDDISKADAIISIQTGKIILYISLIISTISIIGIGVYFIKIKVLNK